MPRATEGSGDCLIVPLSIPLAILFPQGEVCGVLHYSTEHTLLFLFHEIVAKSTSSNLRNMVCDADRHNFKYYCDSPSSTYSIRAPFAKEIMQVKTLVSSDVLSTNPCYYP